jgi:hypothetical protein
MDRVLQTNFAARFLPELIKHLCDINSALSSAAGLVVIDFDLTLQDCLRTPRPTSNVSAALPTRAYCPFRLREHVCGEYICKFKSLLIGVQAKY